MHVVASIQARLGSTRLPGKVLLHLGQERILQWAIDRTKTAETVDQTMVTIGDKPENTAIKEYCKRADVTYISGPEENLLARHLAVADQSDCDLLVRITADCPFVPSDEIDRVINEHQSNDARYTTNLTENMPVGTAVDVIDPGLLSELKSLDETHPVKLARDNPDEWDAVWSDNPEWHKFSNAHIAVDTPNDYWTLIDALDAVGDDPWDVAEWVSQ